MNIFAPTTGVPPTTAVRAETVYWMTGEVPLVDPIGMDVRWYDAEDRQVGACLTMPDGATVITEEEYLLLVAEWEAAWP